MAANPQSPLKALSLAVTGGTLATVTVTNHVGGLMVPGKVASTGASWGSDDLAYPGATYDVSAAVTDSLGEVQTLKASIRVTTLPSTSTVGYNVTPAAGWTVGVNAPIVIRFYKPIKDKAAVERALTVLSSIPTVGAWHWIGSQELHFRPQTAWPAHAQVQLVAALRGVRAGPTLFGLNSSTIDFTVGDAHLTRVDGKKHTLSVYVAGKLFATWPTSLGRPEFATRTGNYIVLLKQPTRRMTSCHANITCDPKNANFYDLTVNWDARLTWSGTFIHSAPWSVSAPGPLQRLARLHQPEPVARHLLLPPGPVRRPGDGDRHQPQRRRPRGQRRPRDDRLEHDVDLMGRGQRLARIGHHIAADVEIWAG